MPKRTKSYRVNAGISYPPDRRAEPGDVVDDLPGADIKRLLRQGVISPLDDEVAEVEETPEVAFFDQEGE